MLLNQGGVGGWGGGAAAGGDIVIEWGGGLLNVAEGKVKDDGGNGGSVARQPDSVW